MVPTRNRGLRRQSSLCEIDSAGPLSKRRSTVFFPEKLLKAELERLRLENDGLVNRLAQIKRKDSTRFEGDNYGSD
ncbi:hypothetical protein QZH41_012161 [Actinostola sp. cb2023]|nr:hypothetical protein QZH41_012161 [Actinostola sp. cb2023]